MIVSCPGAASLEAGFYIFPVMDNFGLMAKVARRCNGLDGGAHGQNLPQLSKDNILCNVGS